MEGQCARCGHCCMYAKFKLPNTERGKDEARWAQLHGCRVQDGQKFFHVYIDTPCSWLAADPRTNQPYCTHYDDRPQICRNYQCGRRPKPVL